MFVILSQGATASELRVPFLCINLDVDWMQDRYKVSCATVIFARWNERKAGRG